ncbi:MAG: hypothetical protein K6F33_02355 [Bacteroidales bacterium]|nr:hypothetical protein [Bacteroidales bacterium]
MKRRLFVVAALLMASTLVSLLPSCIEEAPDRPDTVNYPSEEENPVPADNTNGGSDTPTEDGAVESLTFDAWWTNWSKNYTLKENERMIVTIDGFSSKREELWHNWCLYATSGGWTERNGAGYTEHFIVRGDGGTWVSVDVVTDGSMVAADEAFKNFMQDGTTWTVTIDHNPGQLSVHSEAINPDGVKFVWDATGKVPAGADLWLFFTGEKSAYTIASMEYETLGDAQPISLEVSGLKTAIESGSEEYFDPNTFKVIALFDGDVTKDVTADVIVTVGDNVTIGETEVTVVFAKTLQGEDTEQITYTTKMNVISQIKSIAVKTPPTKTEYEWQLGQKGFEPEGMVVEGLSSDGTVSTLDLKDLTFSDITGEGEQEIIITYKSGDNEITTTQKINVAKYTPLSGKVGLEDRTSAWWTYFLNDKDGYPYGIVVGADEKATISFNCYPGSANHFNFLLFVRNDEVISGTDEQATSIVNCRADNWFWSSTGATAEKGCNNITDADWQAWKSAVEGARVVATFYHKIVEDKHYLDIDIKFYCKNGVIYPQYYHNIPLETPDMVRTYVSVEQAYIDFD